MRGGDLERAHAYYDESAVLAAEFGMRPLAALVQLGRGRLAARAGKPDEARDLVAGAAAALRELRMAWWAARAEPAVTSG